jgi:hypothetical protein
MGMIDSSHQKVRPVEGCTSTHPISDIVTGRSAKDKQRGDAQGPIRLDRRTARRYFILPFRAGVGGKKKRPGANQEASDGRHSDGKLGNVRGGLAVGGLLLLLRKTLSAVPSAGQLPTVLPALLSALLPARFLCPAASDLSAGLCAGRLGLPGQQLVAPGRPTRLLQLSN